MYDIKEKVALITGAANGIGLAIVQNLLSNGLKGVVVVDIIEHGQEVIEALNRQFGTNKAIYVKADVTNEKQFEEAFEKAIATFNTLDIVINNAGIYHDKNWEQEIPINCNSVVRGSLLGVKYMGRNNGGKGGVVVNIASIFGLQDAPISPVYAATKHFVIGLHRSLGQPFYYNLTGVKFLSLCPGVTDTNLMIEAERRCLSGFDGLEKFAIQEIQTLPRQCPEDVAEGIYTVLTKGDNGSIWVAEGGQPAYEVVLPKRESLRKN